MRDDIEVLAAAAYNTWNHVRGVIPEHYYETLPADQQEVWKDVAFAVLVQAVEIAFKHTKQQLEGFIQ